MASSHYLLQIVDRWSGEVVQLEPGMSAEIDFVEACVARTGSLGVGVGRSTQHVMKDVQTAIELTILDLKGKVSSAG
jgi:hypothetical protein